MDTKNSRKIWHIIYRASESEVTIIAAPAKKHGVTMIQMADDIMGTPYVNLPAARTCRRTGLPSRSEASCNWLMAREVGLSK